MVAKSLRKLREIFVVHSVTFVKKKKKNLPPGYFRKKYLRVSSYTQINKLNGSPHNHHVKFIGRSPNPVLNPGVYCKKAARTVSKTKPKFKNQFLKDKKLND